MTGARRALLVTAAICTAAGLSLPLEAALRPTGELGEGLAVLPLTLVLGWLWIRIRPARPLPQLPAPTRGWVVLAGVALTGLLVGWIVAMATSGVIVVPLPGDVSTTVVFATLEELIFRGAPLLLLVGLVARRVPLPAAIVMVTAVLAALFTASHGATTWWTGFDRFVFALLATALVLLQGQLRSAIALHVSSNLFWYAVRDVAVTPALLIGCDLVLMLAAVALLVRPQRPQRSEPETCPEPGSADTIPVHDQQPA